MTNPSAPVASTTPPQATDASTGRPAAPASAPPAHPFAANLNLIQARHRDERRMAQARRRQKPS